MLPRQALVELSAIRPLCLRALASCLLLAALAGFVAAAEAPATYHYAAWTVDEGLPQNSVNSILQTRDGYLWLTTSDGLVRYDGVRFVVFNRSNSAGLGSNRFHSLYQGEDGSLWAGTDDGGLTMQYFGYLRRDPDKAPDMDFSGFDFWLSKLNQFNGDYQRAEMVKAFLDSAEYRQRFGQP